MFDYYHRLSATRQRTYRRSDAITTLALANAELLRPLIALIETARAAEDIQQLGVHCQKLADGVSFSFEVPFVEVQILAVRPSNSSGELHGLYLPEEDGNRAIIQVWMRTAKQKRVVAFKSFLRTLLHELCHHLDYEYLKLEETFHTEGFYSRESSLFHQLTGEMQAGPPRGRE